MIRLLLCVVLLLTSMGVGSGEQVFPGVCFSKVENRHSVGSGRVRQEIDRGTGAFISERLVLTCAHNIGDFTEGSSELSIKDEYGDYYTDVVVVRVDTTNDLALLKVQDEVVREHGIIGIQMENVWYQGPVRNYGYWGAKLRYHESSGETDGKFYGSGPNNLTRAWFTHTGDIHQGMSGGPCLTPEGVLVGVNVASDDQRGYAVGLPIILEFLGR